ncbi:MaoC family dehydratase [Rhodovastum atsumiense]|uniref:MaoC family dehydratase n=1 Tax=Rhodovastum atsumiense TaxID=504468 RepID=A0A5M6IUZ3_9PROT|nr:MaoC family dehydratase [Rhodovastum atsumiense]KAA5612123.1 MaoC family dehydratase [Rhodovastum atsumiense]CAH2603935.1 MaoC family dehydratase [Rhodovastum atsumiense]
MTRLHHFEDFPPGAVFRAGPILVDAARIKSFGVEFDPQPQHIDEEAAAASQFGELVASGWHTAAISMRLFIEALPPIPGGGMGTGVERLSWPRPVRPGDALRVTVEVTAARLSRSRPEKGLVTFQITTFNQRDEVVQSFATAVMVPRRAPSAPHDNIQGENA